MDVYCLLYIVVVCLVLLTSAQTEMKRFRIIKKQMFKTFTLKKNDIPGPEGQWLTQRVDHFRPTDTRTWKQRYYVRDEFFRKGGPVFLYIGGEGLLEGSILTAGLFWEVLASRHNALMVALEHRYYGPTRAPYDVDIYHNVNGFEYLSSEQALADLAYLITKINEEYGLLEGTTKWVAFGGSYAGNLAAWLRLKYPHLIYASVASSAPIRAKLDFPEYMDTDKYVIQKYDVDCFKRFQDIWSLLVHLLRSRMGRRYIQKKFQLCSPFDVENQLDEVSFFESVFALPYGCSQRNYCDSVCEIVMNATKESLLDKYISGLHTYIRMPQDYCWDVSYKGSLQSYSESWYDLSWTYQTCTEFGYFQTSERSDSLLGDRVSLDFYIQTCADLFNLEFTKPFIQKAVDWSNDNYGGLDIDVTRVMFVHGTYDPWHRLGLNQTRNPESPVIMIEGTSHCADMDNYTTGDPHVLLEAQQRIAAILAQWLEQPYSAA